MKISVITPVLNGEKFIRQTVESVIHQQGDFELEYIVCDGESTDRTLDILAEYNDKITVISKKDNSPQEAINKGMKVASGEKTAGFSFSTDVAATEPVIHYQQNIHMLANIDDRPSLTVYGDGRVLVHFPVYMKRAGDYEMQLDETELVSLLQSLSANGVIDFDEKKVKDNIRRTKNS